VIQRAAGQHGEQLRRIGLSEREIPAKVEMLRRCDAALDQLHREPLARGSTWVPGRIEVFGKHTDYAGGRSLLTAVERGVCARVAPRSDAVVSVCNPDTKLAFVTHLHPEVAGYEGEWENYVITTVRRFARDFPNARRGADVAFVSDLPIASGVSSSTALMVTVFLALVHANNLDATDVWHRAFPTRVHLAAYLGAVENGGVFGAFDGDAGVGTLGGNQDQTAILCASAGHVLDFTWMPAAQLASYQLPDTVCFVVGASGVIAEKSAGAREQYNRASLMVQHLLALWNRHTGRSDRALGRAIDSAPDAAERLRAYVVDDAAGVFTVAALQHRLEQFLLETYTLIPDAAAALAAQNWPAFGHATTRSQQAAEDWLGNQIPQTVALVNAATRHGAIAASAFGAGFGGSVWALVRTETVEDFMQRWAATYRAQFPEAGASAMFFATAAGPPAASWSDHSVAR
jgi:galactokinase